VGRCVLPSYRSGGWHKQGQSAQKLGRAEEESVLKWVVRVGVRTKQLENRVRGQENFEGSGLRDCSRCDPFGREGRGRGKEREKGRA